jgi:hypothetical protein
LTGSQASIPGFDKTQQRIPAVVTDLNIIEYTSRLEKAKRNLLEKCIDHEDCGTDIKGHHHSDKEICVDYSWDIMFNDEYRKMKYLDDLDDMDLRSAYLRRMTSMLEYFWRNGIDEVGMRFLHAEGFVTSYEYVFSIDTYHLFVC